MYSREIDGRVLTLSASGWVYIDTFVLYDYETGSLWYHLEGTDGLTCIGGFYRDRHLQEYPATFIRWNQWKKRYPHTKLVVSEED